MQTLLTLHSNLSKTVNKIWAATSSIFHNKTSTNQNFIFIIDKESCYRSRHVLLDAVYILIYWWNMCHCHLKNQHQFIINLLWKTFESWKINCKKEKGSTMLCHVIICNSDSWCGPFKRVMLFSFVSPCYCCGQIPEIWELDHPVGGYWLHTWMWNSYE